MFVVSQLLIDQNFVIGEKQGFYDKDSINTNFVCAIVQALCYLK